MSRVEPRIVTCVDCPTKIETVGNPPRKRCDPCKRKRKKERENKRHQAPVKWKCRIVAVGDGGFKVGDEIPLEEVRATARLGYWPEGTVFHRPTTHKRLDCIEEIVIKTTNKPTREKGLYVQNLSRRILFYIASE
jgi:hypothetical protein